MKTLFIAYLFMVADMLWGLPFNLYGFGREHFVFALATVAYAVWLCGRGSPEGTPAKPLPVWLTSLLLCALWLIFYPLHNGWDVVVAPLLLWVVALWVWRKARSKTAKRQ